MKFLAQILTFLIAGLFASSCFENPDCIDLRNNLVGFAFKKLYDGEADTVSLMAVSISGVGFTPVENASAFYLPLNVAQSGQVFDFELIRGGYSTAVEQQRMVVSYKSQSQFESQDCTPRFILSDLRVAEQGFDSINIRNSIPLSKNTGTNIDLYRCPFTNNLKISFRQLRANDESNGVELKEKLKGVSLDYLPINFYPNSERGSITIPVNVAANATRVNIDTQEGSIVDLTYSRENRELVKGCGSQPIISEIQVASATGYDIVRIQKDSITDPPSTNVALLRCPNTNLISLLLKNSSGTETAVQIKKITTGFSAETFFEDSLASKIVLPLDVNKDQTDYVFEFETAVKKISFGYIRTQQTFHEVCNQTLFSKLQVVSSEFTSAPIVVKDSIQFPTVVNFEIIND